MGGAEGVEEMSSGRFRRRKERWPIERRRKLSGESYTTQTGKQSWRGSTGREGEKGGGCWTSPVKRGGGGGAHGTAVLQDGGLGR